MKTRQSYKYQRDWQQMGSMGAVRWVAVIVVVLVIFALFVPVFPMTSQSGSFFGASYSVNADVSLSFLATHCGSYVNARESANLGGIQLTHPISKGYNFACNFSTSNTTSFIFPFLWINQTSEKRRFNPNLPVNYSSSWFGYDDFLGREENSYLAQSSDS